MSATRESAPSGAAAICCASAAFFCACAISSARRALSSSTAATAARATSCVVRASSSRARARLVSASRRASVATIAPTLRSWSTRALACLTAASACAALARCSVSSIWTSRSPGWTRWPSTAPTATTRPEVCAAICTRVGTRTRPLAITCCSRSRRTGCVVRTAGPRALIAHHAPDTTTIATTIHTPGRRSRCRIAAPSYHGCDTPAHRGALPLAAPRATTAGMPTRSASATSGDDGSRPPAIRNDRYPAIVPSTIAARSISSGRRDRRAFARGHERLTRPAQVLDEHRREGSVSARVQRRHTARLMEQHDERRVRREERVVRRDHGGEPLGQRGRPDPDRGCSRGGGPRRPAPTSSAISAILGLEVVVEGALAEVAALGDVLDAGAVDPALGDQPERDVEQGLPGLVLLALAPSGYVIHGRLRLSLQC